MKRFEFWLNVVCSLAASVASAATATTAEFRLSLKEDAIRDSAGVTMQNGLTCLSAGDRHVVWNAVKGINAAQRYPWNGMVDISFTITGDAGTAYQTTFSAKDVAGGTNLVMETV